MIKMTLVAPKNDLDWVEQEIQTCVNLPNMSLRLVRSPASRREVTEVLTRMPKQDILMFSAHGTEQGVELDDGLATPTDLLMWTNASYCDLLILNSCSSAALAGGIIRNSRASVLTNLEAQPDYAAWRMSTLFLSQLVRGGTPVQAFLRTAINDPNCFFFRSLRE